MRQHALAFATAAAALFCITISLWHLEHAKSDVTREAIVIGHIPATIYQPVAGKPAPAVVIAHGFAGSQQLMQSFALTFAHNGYIAITFDFAGHGRNPLPLTGNITREDGATQTLVSETRQVLDTAHRLSDGRLALLGHSMASDIVVRAAESDPRVAATIAVSMFSPAVTRSAPRNLLILAGDWESMLKGEALRAVSLAIAPEPAREGVTYGNFADGTARRAAFVDHAEHISVLFRSQGLEQSVTWLDSAFGRLRDAPPTIVERGQWLALLFSGIALLLKPASLLLPRVSAAPLGAGLSGRELRLPILLPAILTPCILRVLPTHFLPVLVADYLALHFGLYGILTFACLRYQGHEAWPRFAGLVTPAFVAAILGLTSFYAIALFWPLDAYFTSFLPSFSRLFLIAAMTGGTLTFFAADEWLTRGPDARWWVYLATKLAFLGSLAAAVALDFERLFFLIIIIPAVVLFFIFFGLVSAWTYRRTWHPLVAAAGNGLALAVALGVAFPQVAG